MPGTPPKSASQPSRGTQIAGGVACIVILGAIGYFGQGQLHRGGKSTPIIDKPSTDGPVQESLLPMPPVHQSPKVVSLNQGTKEDFDSLPGIGPVIAQQIVDFRTEHGAFETIEDVQQVTGVGPKLFDKIKDRLKL